jgi:hypothetical protein
MGYEIGYLPVEVVRADLRTQSAVEDIRRF